jgi:hypothetical protein
MTISAETLERVVSSLATVMKDTCSADLMDAAYAVYDRLDDSMGDLEETIQTTWTAVVPEVQSILRNFVRSISFNANLEPHQLVYDLHQQLTNSCSLAPSDLCCLATA